jgi:hypothetical protein
MGWKCWVIGIRKLENENPLCAANDKLEKSSA